MFIHEYGKPHITFHLIASVAVLGAGFYFNISVLEWVGISIAIGMVLVAEIFNSAIEVLVDLVQPNWDKKAGIIKDMAAGGVLISAIVAGAIGTLILGPYILKMI